jgi:Spy/CpxP family protein refolding chaperone
MSIRSRFVKSAALTVLLVTTGSAFAASSSDPPPQSAPAPQRGAWRGEAGQRDEHRDFEQRHHFHHHHHHHHHRHGQHFRHRPARDGQAFMRMPLFASLRALNLTADQRKSIHDILLQSRQQAQAKIQSGTLNRAALANPGDPNFAAAVDSAKAMAAQRIQQAADLEKQVYNVLTAEQKTQLTQRLAQMQQRRAAWEGRGGFARRPGQSDERPADQR